MNLLTSQSATGVASQRVFALPVAGIPDNSKVSGFWLEVVISASTRGGTATALSPEELAQTIVLYQHNPGNSKYSVSCSGHRLGYNRYLCTSKRPGSAITLSAETGTFDLWIPTSPMQGVGGINKGMRPFGSELNGSTVQITFDPASAALGGITGQFASVDVELRLYAAFRETTSGETDLGGRLAIIDSDDFVGTTLPLSDGQCSLLAIESRGYTSISVNAGGFTCSTANTPYASDLASQPFQLSSEAGGATAAEFVTGLVASDTYLANYPQQDDGGNVPIGISRAFDLRNHADAPSGTVMMTMTGRPASTAIGYLVHYIR